jgi:hypothetical protein
MQVNKSGKGRGKPTGTAGRTADSLLKYPQLNIGGIDPACPDKFFLNWGEKERVISQRLIGHLP